MYTSYIRINHGKHVAAVGHGGIPTCQINRSRKPTSTRSPSTALYTFPRTIIIYPFFFDRDRTTVMTIRLLKSYASADVRFRRSNYTIWKPTSRPLECKIAVCASVTLYRVSCARDERSKLRTFVLELVYSKKRFIVRRGFVNGRCSNSKNNSRATQQSKK